MMTGISAVRVLGICFLAAGALAQQDNSQFSVAGAVIDSRSGEVVKRAQVLLMHLNSSPRDAGGAQPVVRPSLPSNWTTFTDSAGVFRFSALSTGNYVISVRKPGFTETTAQSPNAISGRINLTASLENVQLTLAPLGAIGGKVMDQEGQPLRGVNVIALSERMDDGLRRTQAVRNVATNDRGEYRMWNFTPGKYYIKAAGRTGGTYLYAGDVAPRYIADESFSPAYFGSGKTLDSAQPINIEAGTDARADINLVMEASHKIRGVLGNFAPRRTVKFELLSGDEDESPSRVSMNGDTGKFEIQDVIPGVYTLRATQADTSAEVPVNVTGADVDGLLVPLSPGVDIRVHSQFTSQPIATETNIRFRVGLSQGGAGFCSASLHPPGRRAGLTYSGKPSPASTGGALDDFVLAGVLAGVYRSAIQCHGGYVRSAMFGTQDLLLNPLVAIQPGLAPPPIEIVATWGGGRINGNSSIESIKKDATIHVLLVPQFTASTGPVLAAFRPGSGFPLRLDNLSPGPYNIYAFSNDNDIEYRNPIFLQSLTGGVSVQVEDNIEKAVAITGLVR